MRRGHSGIGGWRSENTRHFRARGGGNPHYRPRGYPLLETPRFPHPSPRPHRPSFSTRSGHLIEQNEEQNRTKYRYDNRKNVNRAYEKHNDRQPYQTRFRQNETLNHTKAYKETQYYDGSNHRDGTYVNSHGDVDHRQSNVVKTHQFKKQAVSWVMPNDYQAPQYDDRNQNRPYRHHNDTRKSPVLDYPGHRPPASDHYGGNPTSTIDNSNSFSRSVDDTVNIVRKRLLNRNECHQISDCLSTDSSNPDNHREHTVDSFNDAPQEQPVRRRIQKQVLKEKSNCDKIKNKIVHQLFKMDKEKIHKLMDNPNSSTKFEYAINSLITESQNSFNRHLRSVAEKSLCSSSTDFIQNDNNTIYEDTFLKQMQCILDPQDTVFLEDIKPIVMAELTKVLQLDDLEQNFTEGDRSNLIDIPPKYNQCDTTFNSHQNCSEDYSENYNEQSHSYTPFRIPNIEEVKSLAHGSCNKIELEAPKYPKPLLERRQRTKSCTHSDERVSSSGDLRLARRSLDNNLNEDIYKSIDDPLCLFGSNTQQLSEDDDPFADLDEQYHVAVDHNFISTEVACSSQLSTNHTTNVSTNLNTNINALLQTTEVHDIKQEVESQILDIAKSPLKLSLNVTKKTYPEEKEYDHQNLQSSLLPEKVGVGNSISIKEIPVNHENIAEEPEKSMDPYDTSKSLSSLNSRKRPIDKQTSHRKEKRKKVESCAPDLSQKVNKNNIPNIETCTSKTPEKCHIAKSPSSVNPFKTDYKTKTIPKDLKISETTDKEYSDKYVKRKIIEKNSKEKNNGCKNKHNMDSIICSANNKNETISNVSQTPTKVECKNTLKTIDMFSEKPKKINIHQAHRNTAVLPSTSNLKTNLEKKKKKRGSRRKKLKRHIATQVFKRLSIKETQTDDGKSFCTRSCQTEKEEVCFQAIQTDPIIFKRSVTNSTDAFERMKEIDLEIQVLLQEKFKLYSSLENKDSSQNSLQTLGMTVLNVTPFEEEVCIKINDDVETLSADVIADDFTNIPVDELEQIAFESVQMDSTDDDTRVGKRSRRQVVIEQDRKRSLSPRANKKNNKKVKTPNISLIEQIITDDRPLEDIIALDDLERPVKTRSKTQKIQSVKKKSVKKQKYMRSHSDFMETNIFEIKDCSVVLVRQDLNKLLIQNTYENYEFHESLYEPVEYTNYADEVEIKENNEINDVQFDMLDVSEDIVIDDNCEIKSIQDKVLETIEVPINEEIILDNSQSSEDVSAAPPISGDVECKMYDYSADENLRRDAISVTGNADAVLAIECIENNFIAACLDGNVYYFSGDGQLINTLRGSNLAVTCLTIVKEKYGTTVYTGSLDSRIRYYDLETGIEKGPECNVLSPIQTMDRAWDTVFVGTRTGFVLQFECKNNMLIPVSTVKFSDQSILALRAMKEGPRKVLLVAARSENVTIKDAQTGLLLRTLSGPKMTVYTLLYEDGKVYCGTSSHQIQVFDYTSGTHVGAHEGGKGAVCLRATGGLLFAGCYDGCVYVYREGEARPMAQLRGPGLMLLSLAVVGSKIIAGYKDRSLYIWKIPLSILQEMIL